MAYDEALDARISESLAAADTERRSMFGGTGYLLEGNMMAGVWRDSLVLRLGPDEGEAALGEPRTRPFDVTGRSMRGWIMVEPGGYEGEALEEWLLRARAFAETLPPK